jgi:hypothetical protein
MGGFQKFLSRDPIFGGLVDAPEIAEHQKALAQAAADYQAMRPEYAQARLNALEGTLGAYRGAENLLASRYGAGVLPQPGTENPFSPRSQVIGQRNVNIRGPDAGSIGGGMATGAGTGAIAGSTFGPYGAAIGAAGGALYGLGAGLMDTGVEMKPVDYGAFAPYRPNRPRRA